MNYTKQRLEELISSCNGKKLHSVGANILLDIASDLLEAHGIIDRLPKTKDGAPVVPGVSLYRLDGNNAYCDDDGRLRWVDGRGQCDGYLSHHFYSTEALAQAAAGEGSDTH